MSEGCQMGQTFEPAGFSRVSGALPIVPLCFPVRVGVSPSLKKGCQKASLFIVLLPLDELLQLQHALILLHGHAADIRAQGNQLVFNVIVSPIDILDIVDLRDAIRH